MTEIRKCKYIWCDNILKPEQKYFCSLRCSSTYHKTVPKPKKSNIKLKGK